MTVFNWGVLGTGNIASSMAEALALVPNAKRAAVASRSLDKAKSFAGRWGFDCAHGDYGSLFSDREIDIVYIATPNACHKDNILEALNAGKHVLCEKPLTLSEGDSAECFDFAEHRGLLLMEALWTAYFPAMRKAVELVGSGAIGNPSHLRAQFVSYRAPETHPILFDPALGGGARNDLGIYPVAAALLLAGPVASSTIKSVVGSTGVDEMTMMTIEHQNGVTSELTCGFRSELPISLQVIGEQGILSIADRFHCPQHVSLERGGQITEFELPSLGVGYAHEVEAAHDVLSGRVDVSSLWGRAQTLASARVLSTEA